MDSVTKKVAENIGQALSNTTVAQKLGSILFEAFFVTYFRPIVRSAVAEAIGYAPENIGPELIEEALKDGITAPYIATVWFNEKRLPEMIRHLREQYGEKYKGLDKTDVVTQVATNVLIIRDEDLVLANAVQDKLLSPKKEK